MADQMGPFRNQVVPLFRNQVVPLYGRSGGMTHTSWFHYYQTSWFFCACDQLL